MSFYTREYTREQNLKFIPRDLNLFLLGQSEIYSDI